MQSVCAPHLSILTIQTERNNTAIFLLMTNYADSWQIRCSQQHSQHFGSETLKKNERRRWLNSEHLASAWSPWRIFGIKNPFWISRREKIRAEADGSCLQLFSYCTTEGWFLSSDIFIPQGRRRGSEQRRKTQPSVRHNYTCNMEYSFTSVLLVPDQSGCTSLEFNGFLQKIKSPPSRIWAND